MSSADPERTVDPDRAQAEFEQAGEELAQAIRGHRMAQPDAGFSSRLAALSRACAHQATACAAAHEAGFEWPPVRPADPPYELQRGTGRRGPADLWLIFDQALEELNRVSQGRSLAAVARGYTELARAAEQLARAVAVEDGLVPAIGEQRRSS